MPWTDPGATATDAEDGNLPVTVGGDTVDTSTVGTYNVTYSATDSGGLTTTETRQVDVVAANTAPVVTLNGFTIDAVSARQDAPVVDLNGFRYHIVDDETPVSVNQPPVVSLNGFIHHIVDDETPVVANQPPVVSLNGFMHHIVDPDNTYPVITVAGDAIENILLGSVYTDAGATATDAEDGALTVTTIGTVDTNTEGGYYLIYSATDSKGLTSYAFRQVNVAASFALKAVEATNNIAAMLNEQYVNDPSVIAAMTALLPAINTGDIFVQAPSYNGGISTLVGTTLPHNISLAASYGATSGPPPTSGPLGQLTIADFLACSSYTADSGIFSAWTLGQQVKIIDEDYHVLLINDNNGTAVPGACELDASPSTGDYTSDINGGIYLGYVDPATRVISGVQEITTAPFTNQVGLQVFLSKDATPANLATVVTLA